MDTKNIKKAASFSKVDAMIDDIISSFDWGRVQTVMEYIGWRWEGNRESPSLDELKEKAVYLLKGASDLRLGSFEDAHWELNIMNGTGGFEASAFCNEDKTEIIALDLKFIIAEWDCCLEDLESKVDHRLFGTQIEEPQHELIELLMGQVVELSLLSKIELGDDVLAEIKRLKEKIKR